MQGGYGLLRPRCHAKRWPSLDRSYLNAHCGGDAKRVRLYPRCAPKEWAFCILCPQLHFRMCAHWCKRSANTWQCPSCPIRCCCTGSLAQRWGVSKPRSHVRPNSRALTSSVGFMNFPEESVLGSAGPKYRRVSNGDNSMRCNPLPGDQAFRFGAAGQPSLQAVTPPDAWIRAPRCLCSQ